jgi:hypothetical protein
MGRIAIVLAGLLVGLGLAAAGYLVGEGFAEAREPVRRVTVRGLSEREVRADMAEWPLQLTAASDDLQAAARMIDEDVKTLTAFAGEAGVPAADVVRGRVQVTDQSADPYRQGGYTGPRYVVSQSVLIRSGEVAGVEALSRRTSDLIARGVVVQDNQGPSFVYTRLAEVKPEMIAEATRDARAAAEQFAEDSGAEVGAILNATQGYFSISPLIETNPYASPGEQVDKKVRVVTTVDFELVE